MGIEVKSESKLHDAKTLVHMCKEGAEIVIFSMFAQKGTMSFFDHTCLHYICMPILATSFAVDAIIESILYAKDHNKNARTTFNLILTIGSAGLINTAVWGTLFGAGAFTIGPYLFVIALNLIFIKLFSNLISNITKYQACTIADEKKSYLQSAFMNAVSLFGVILICATVTGILIFPAGPLVALILGLSAALFSLGMLVWRVSSTETKHKIKSKIGLFCKSTYLAPEPGSAPSPKPV